MTTSHPNISCANTSLVERLDALLALHPKVIDLSLTRINRLLSVLGSPHLAVPPVIHVAGTNGKGSTVATLEAMLTAAGKRVHRYISPHLVRFNERIVLIGQEVSDDTLINALDRVAAANAGAPITFFEISTAAAFLLFAEHPADVLLLEVGLGGRLDATNVIPQPLASIIAPVSFDHMDFLGNTLQAIAGEKAGIIKQQVPVFCAIQKQPALNVIAQTAMECDAPLYCAGLDWQYAPQNDGFVYQGSIWENLALPLPALQGAHQLGNAALAIACLEQLPMLGVTPAHIREGLKTVHWPGRLQPLTKGRLKALLPVTQALWVDGSHNVAGAETLADVLASWGQPVHVVLGMLQTKDCRQFLEIIKPHVLSLRTVPIARTPKTYSAEDLAAIAGSVGIAAISCETVGDALREIAALDSTAPVLITGSLYLAGEVLGEN